MQKVSKQEIWNALIHLVWGTIQHPDRCVYLRIVECVLYTVHCPSMLMYDRQRCTQQHHVACTKRKRGKEASSIAVDPPARG